MRINKQTFILISCWLLINGLLFYFSGIKYAIDTARFEAEADSWLNGQVQPSYHLWYSGYIALLFICKSMLHSIYPSIFFQCMFSLFATICFYRGLCTSLKNSTGAFIATLLVICYMPIQQWNTCLLTESIFISLVLLFVYALSLDKKSHKWLFVFLISILASAIRPNGGILLITCCMVYGIRSVHWNTLSAILFSAGTISILFLLHNFTSVFYQFLLNSFNTGEIICGYAYWTVPAKTTITDDVSKGSITKIADLIFSNPVKSTQLFISRLLVLWADVRIYYSLIHNLFIGMYLTAAYAAAVTGFIQYRKNLPEFAWASILYCGLHSMLIMVTYADWDGRFLAPLLPVVFIWSGLGIYFASRFLKRKNKEV